jgi:heptosyltransferase-2
MSVPPGGTAVPLLVRLPNWVGDACMALPTIGALEAAGFAPTLAGRGWAADLFAGHGWPVLKLPGGVRAAARTLRAAGPRRGLLLTNSLSSALAFRLGGVKGLGHRNEGRALLLGRALPRPQGLHEVETFWRLGQATAAWMLGGEPWPAPPRSLGLRLAAGHVEAARRALRDAGLEAGGYVVIAPLATGTVDGRPKVWPGFADLDRALNSAGVRTVCCPGPGEEAAASAAAPCAALLPGLGLGAYAAVCATARLTVANDSGPMHLAAATDAPVLGLFGPGDPARTHPWSPGARWFGGQGHWPEPGRVLDAVLAAVSGATGGAMGGAVLGAAGGAAGAA